MRAEIIKTLQKLHRRGNIAGGVVNIIVGSVSTYFQSDDFFENPQWLYAFLLIFAGAIVRISSSFLKKKWSILFGNVGALLLGLGWGYHFCVVTDAFGLASVNASYMLLVLGGVVNAAGSSFRANKEQYLIFVTTLAIVVSLKYLIAVDSSFRYMIFYVLSFYILNVITFKITSKQLFRSVESEISAKNESEKFSRLINAVPGFVTILDEDLNYKEANGMTLDLYPDILGRKLGSYGTSTSYVQLIRDFAASGKDIETKEIFTQTEKNSYYFLTSLQRTSKNEFVVVAIPMDELVKARQELRVQEAKAMYSAKLASLGEMAASIAHEVNNPLAIIEGSAALIQKLVDETPIDTENVKILTTKMVDTSERISKTIRSLKNLSRTGEKDPFSTLSLQKVVDECLDICRHRFEQESILLKLPSAQKKINFQARDIQISQVFLNLLNNALDAVVLSPQCERWIEIKAEEDSKSVMISITDSGPGIPQEFKTKIMEPFFTTKEIGHGTGLGLSISKNLIEENGGELTLDHMAKNTTFRIYLPKEQVNS